MQVGTTGRVGIVAVPAGSHSSKSLDVLTIALRIEEQHIAQSLEQSEVCISLVGLSINVIFLHLLLVLVHQLIDAVVSLLNGQVLIIANGDGTLAEVYLLQ